MRSSNENGDIYWFLWRVNIAKAASDAVAMTAACEVLSRAIHGMDSRIGESCFTSMCGTVARCAMSPTGAVVHAASFLICGDSVN
jgi:hypothetical protein